MGGEVEEGGVITEPVKIVRIFITDGSYVDSVLGTPWEVFVHGLITNGCVITSNAWINRSAIVKVIQLEAPDDAVLGDNVLQFTPPQGRA